jgi:heme exporter protein A
MGGFDLADESIDIRRHIGLVSHQTLLYGDLTPDENLRFYGRMYDVPDLEDRIGTVLRQVGLEGRRHDPVRTFSRGMQQRLAIARAILHRPSVLLLDEPDTGLDQQAAGMLHELLASVGTKDRTVLMTTHNLERGLSMGNRVAVLAGGRIAYEADKGTLDVEGFHEIYYRSVREDSLRVKV